MVLQYLYHNSRKIHDNTAGLMNFETEQKGISEAYIYRNFFKISKLPFSQFSLTLLKYYCLLTK